MTVTFNRYGIYEADHSTFGGIVCPSDFDRKTTLSEIAERIAKDQMDKYCKKNIVNNQNNRRK